MKGNYKKELWLFLIPLCLPLLILGIQRRKEEKVFRSDAGGFPTAKTGERSALIGISHYLKEMPDTGRIAKSWTVTNVAPGPNRGTSFYALEFDRRRNTLTYRAHPQGKDGKVNWPIVYVYENVKEADIHRAAIQLTPNTTTKQIENYKGGDIEELKQYGARLKSKQEL